MFKILIAEFKNLEVFLIRINPNYETPKNWYIEKSEVTNIVHRVATLHNFHIGQKINVFPKYL